MPSARPWGPRPLPFLQTIALLLCLGSAHAQAVYPPAPYTPATEAWKKRVEDRKEQRIATLPATLGRTVRNEVAERWEAQAEDLLMEAADSLYIFSGPLHAYLVGVLRTLQAADPEVPGDIDLVLTRYPWPNASNMGQGTIKFNVGLLERMENEEQVAFVLGHELAHQRSDHLGRHMIEMAEKWNSRDFKRELRDVKRLRYGRTERLRDLMAGFLSPARRHGREHESQADSLALAWVMRAGYDPVRAIGAMDVLDRSDEERDTATLDLERIFHRPRYPFQAEWVQYGGASSLGHFERTRTALDDSLKTHPDCAQRKERMQAFLAGHPAGDVRRTDDAALATVARTSANECIESFMASQNYGRAMFLALCGLERDSTDQYLHAVVSRCFSGLHTYSVAHRLGHVLDHTNDAFSDNYNRLLAFLHALRQRDHAELAWHYLDPWRDAEPDNEDLLYATMLAHRCLGRTTEAADLGARYTTLFPSGRFARSLGTH